MIYVPVHFGIWDRTCDASITRVAQANAIFAKGHHRIHPKSTRVVAWLQNLGTHKDGRPRLSSPRIAQESYTDIGKKNSGMMRKKLRPEMLISIQILRALAAWIVVGHHVTQLLPPFRDNSQISQFFVHYGAYGVDLFFVISGFVIYLSSSKSHVTPREFLLHRIVRVVPAYWIFTALTAIALFFDSTIVALTTFEWPFFIRCLFFVPAMNPSGIGPYPLLTVGWTLNYEMVFYAIYLLAMFAPTKLRTGCVIIGVLMLTFLVPKLGGAFAFYGDAIVLEFLLGVLIGVAYKQGILKKTNAAAGALLVLFGLVVIGEHGGIGHNFAWIGLPCAMIVFGTITLEKYAVKARFAKSLGDWSYSTYLCHALILSLAYRAYQVLELPLLTTLLLAIAAIVLVSWLSFSLIENRLAKSARNFLNPEKTSASLA
ncbi:acyltransferase family protein [Ralstonia sp. 24A2]|uniref:acyltransferase family protein n=1 Tax=Ralstonia sp. 24A2 TaxID=3447364 RepID=UPI003F697BA7